MNNETGVEIMCDLFGKLVALPTEASVRLAASCYVNHLSRVCIWSVASDGWARSCIGIMLLF